MAKVEPIQCITPTFILGYPNLVEARQYMENGKPKGDPKYSMQMILDPDSLGQFKVPNANGDGFEDADFARLCVKAAKRAFGDDYDVKEAVKHGGIKWPIVPGSQKAEEADAKGKDGSHYEGKKVVNATCTQDYPPSLKYTENGQRKQINRGMDQDVVKAKSLFYGGAKCIAELSIKAMTVSGNNHIVIYFNSVMFVANGERLGGQSLMDRFDGVTGGESDHDPTEGLDDEIPF